MSYNDLFYIGLKGVFCFKPPYPQLCEIVVPTSTSPSTSSSSTSTVSTVTSLFPAAVFGTSDSDTGIIYIYTYSTNEVSKGTSLTYVTSDLAAAGNSTLGVFGGGLDGLHVLSSTSIYTYASNIAAAGTSLTYSAQLLAAAGNSVIGVFGGGSPNPLSTTSIYTYSSNKVSVGTNLTFISLGLAAAGNSTLGVFGGGRTYIGSVSPSNLDSGSVSSENSLSNTSIYTYSSNVTTAGTNLTYIASGLAAAGNSTLGVFGCGSNVQEGNFASATYLIISSTTSIYTYASNTTVAGTNLTISSQALTAAGNSTIGIFGVGGTSGLSSATSIYTYASNTTAAGADIVYGGSFESNWAAVSSSNVGVI